MKLFYAPLQKMLKLSEKIRHFFLLSYLNVFCVCRNIALMFVWDG